MGVPFLNLKELHEDLRPDLESAASRVLASGRFVLGPEVERFEWDFAASCGAAHAVAVHSGTCALHLSLLAAGVRPGDEVVTVPATFIATVSAIEYVGARPVLVDVDPRYHTLDPEKFEAAITQRTRAVIPVHLYGQPADMDPIREVARRHGLAVIEDACQAHGASYRGKKVGSLGDLACFSFYPSKNLGACGEGGAVVTNNPDFDRTIRMLRDWGQQGKYHHVRKGFNYRMDELQAAFLSVKLPRLDEWNASRRRSADLYAGALKNVPVLLPREMPGTRHVYHVYPILVEDREETRRALHEEGIETGIHYPRPVHLMPAFENLGYRPESFPVAERLAEQELSLPMYPGMRPEDVASVARALTARCAGSRPPRREF